jgi:hypothetical protein
LPSAFNLIDGYNGLAGTVALICCLAIAWVAFQVGDREIVALMLVTVFLMSERKPFAWTFYPMIFMFFTAITVVITIIISDHLVLAAIIMEAAVMVEAAVLPFQCI